MRLIKRGTKLEEDVFVGQCHHCGSEFEAPSKELHIQNDRDGRLAQAKCTICHQHFWLYPKK